MSDATERITPADIEARFRRIQDTVEGRTAEAKAKAVPAVAVGGILLLLLVFLIGRRVGRKSSTVVEIRRI